MTPRTIPAPAGAVARVQRTRHEQRIDDFLRLARGVPTTGDELGALIRAAAEAGEFEPFARALQAALTRG